MTVSKKYGKPVVVFDGYGTSLTKDMAHRRRAKGKKGPTVSFTKEMNLTVAKDLFLSDQTNKQQFIKYLAQDLESAGCQVCHATADADVLIVQKAVDSSELHDTILVGDDTDLLVLALYHSKPSGHQLYFAPAPKKNSKQRVWDINQTKNDLGTFFCKHILFQHAILGCDTTSRLFGIGKGAIVKKFKTNAALQQAADVFDLVSFTPNDIESAGEKALVAIYNGKKEETLNTLRLTRYCEKVTKSLTQVEPRSLPPQVLLQNTTATESFSKYASGKAMNVTCPQSYGDGILLMESSIPQQQIFLQLPLTC